MDRRLMLAALAAVGVALTGCRSMAPEYERPAAPVAGQFANVAPAADAATAAADIPWQDYFADQRLRANVEHAIVNNRDLRAAVLNIDRARALYGIQHSALFPSVNASASGVKQRIPEGLFGGLGGSFNAEQYSANVGVSGYELDIFGRIRSLNDRAVQTYLATEEVRKAVQIGLVAEVAHAYLTYAADHERLALARETLASQQASLDLTRQRLEGGVANALDVRQAETTVENARADVARFTALVAQDRNALDLIVGVQVADDLLPTAPLDPVTAIADLPAGVPSEVLQQRPDILAAEHQLQAMYASIGAARANFFPTISLTGSVGTASRELFDLFTVGTGAWAFLPQVSVPIFNAGRNKATLQVAEIDRELALASYERAIQGAFREVSDALAVRATIDEQLDAQQRLVAAAADGLRLADARFRGGVDSYLPVLDAQRALYQSQQGLIAVRLARGANAVNLYRALGGGWTPAPSVDSEAATTSTVTAGSIDDAPAR